MPDGRRPVEGRDISSLTGALRRRGWIVLVCVIVAGAAGYLFAKQQAPSFEASTNLLLRDPPAGPANVVFTSPTPNTAPDREALVLSEQVRERVEAALAPKLGGRAQAHAAFVD